MRGEFNVAVKSKVLDNLSGHVRWNVFKDAITRWIWRSLEAASLTISGYISCISADIGKCSSFSVPKASGKLKYLRSSKNGTFTLETMACPNKIPKYLFHQLRQGKSTSVSKQASSPLKKSLKTNASKTSNFEIKKIQHSR